MKKKKKKKPSNKQSQANYTRQGTESKVQVTDVAVYKARVHARFEFRVGANLLLSSQLHQQK